MTSAENKKIDLDGQGLAETLAEAVKVNMRQQIIAIISQAPEYKEDDPETQAFINLWVEEAWEEYKQNGANNIKLRKVEASDKIW